MHLIYVLKYRKFGATRKLNMEARDLTLSVIVKFAIGQAKGAYLTI